MRVRGPHQLPALINDALVTDAWHQSPGIFPRLISYIFFTSAHFHAFFLTVCFTDEITSMINLFTALHLKCMQYINHDR